jgi:xanthine dehydrogenase accessory factor
VKPLWDLCRELEAKGESFAIITLIAERGHVPQDLGAKALVTKDGLLAGTIGGGKVEAKAIRHAQARLEAAVSAPELLVWNLTKDVSMTCGGEVTFLFENHFSSSWKIAVFGAGHVAQAIVPLLSGLDCRLYCVDPRAEWIERLPKAGNLEAIVLAEPKELVRRLDKDTFFLCLGQGHSHDLPVLEEISKVFPEPKYVGSIGSAVKASTMRKNLLDRGVSANFIEKMRCPVGLAIGSNHPVEIAISIAAEILQVRDSVTGREELNNR